MAEKGNLYELHPDGPPGQFWGLKVGDKDWQAISKICRAAGYEFDVVPSALDGKEHWAADYQGQSSKDGSHLLRYDSRRARDAIWLNALAVLATVALDGNSPTISGLDQAEFECPT